MAVLPSQTGPPSTAPFQGSLEALKDALLRLNPPYVLLKYDATPEEYEQITDEDIRCEYLDGVLIVHSPASFRHENLVSFLTALLGNFVGSRRSGWVCGSNTVMQVGERRLCPDVSFLAQGHGERVHEGRVVGPFDLVIEVISSSTRRYDLGEKRAAYREARVPETWLIDPEQRRFEADVLEGDTYGTQVLTTGRWSSHVLPGFTLDVSWLWAEPPPNPLECRA